ncbi:Uncharacterized protein FKW44_020783 [Caligus rogercresseyi]|uniref:Uncharacterized protein n=1 Tax=Caligus rogercresseyi TaxID=217165 RepID=A0A7T8GQG4_CALRO|nr:Uncharacterized protein FKW44_020783 [Caligus rogercresseyi]
MERKDFEIRTNIKFLVRHGWKGTDIIQALETVYEDHAPRKLVSTNGLEDSKKAEKLLKMKKASHFFLFPKLKEHLKGVRFNTTDESKTCRKNLASNQPADFFKNGIMDGNTA